jgi:hypothetical protein
MKKIILVFAAVLFLSLTAAYAQQDTTDVSYADPAKEMIQITARDLPAPVRETLSMSTYKGWETGEIFRNENSDRFLVRINDGTKPKVYSFDKNGRPIETP